MGKRRGYLMFAAVGMLAVLCGISLQKLSVDGNIIWDSKWLIYVLSCSLAGGSALGCVVFQLLLLAEQRMHKHPQVIQSRKIPQQTVDGRKAFFCSWLCMCLCWLPAYLAYYPAICSYDMTIQLGQILERAYNDHHPIFHTLMIRGFMELGEVFGSVNLGIGLYALLQMLVLAAAFGAGIALLAKNGVKRVWLILLTVYGCVFPFHMYMSISVTKDTLFAAFLLLMLILLGHLLDKEQNTLKPAAADAAYLLCAIGVIVFRGNGRYAILVLLAALVLTILCGKKVRKMYARILTETVAAFIVGSVLLNGVFELTGAGQGDRREMLSMPIQQLARVMVYHSGEDVVPADDHTLDEASKALLNDFMLNEAWKNYRPDIADPVKRHTNTYVARFRAKEFVKTYIGLFLRYPGDYINAALATNAGYLYPGDESHAVINVNGRDRGLGYVQTRWVENELNPAGIYKDSKWEWLHGKLEEFADSNRYLKIPILKYVFVPGTYLWLYLFLAAWLWYHKNYRCLIPLALVGGYYLTLFLGPTVQLRYLYPLMVAWPFLAILFGAGSRNGQKSVTPVLK